MAKKIGSLWKNSKQGENYPVATGIVELVIGCPVKVALFKNTKKQAGTKQPDYTLVVSEPQEKKDGNKDYIKMTSQEGL